MQYTVNELATLSGVSVRTLHYYDQIGLLCPVRTSNNGYRSYGQKEVDLLQQILFYRELEVPLKEIKSILESPEYDRTKVLEEQLAALLQRKSQIDLLIDTIQKTIGNLKGEMTMGDTEKFVGFKEKMIEENEKRYGAEARERYGEEAVHATHAKLRGMSEEVWQNAEELSEQINKLLKEAFELGDPRSDIAQKVCDLHRQWLCMFWQEGMYSKEVHLALAEGYVADERFTAYYDKIATGCTRFLRDAIAIYVQNK